MRIHPETKKAGEAAAADIAALPYNEWRLAVVAMLQEMEREADETGKEEAFGLLLFELIKNLQARVNMRYW